MNRSILIAAAALLLVGCETTPEARTEVRTVEVQVPVARSCVPASTPPKPVFRVTREVLLAAPDAAVRLALAVAGMLERDARLGETEPVLEACRD